MRIEPKIFQPAIAGATAQKRPGAARFALDSQPTAPRAGIASASALADVGALLALQGEGDATERRRRSVKRGNELLDGLDRIKAALLAGRLPAGELSALAARLGERPDLSGDPRLDELLAQIELRAGVELAKLRRVR